MKKFNYMLALGLFFLLFACRVEINPNIFGAHTNSGNTSSTTDAPPASTPTSTTQSGTVKDLLSSNEFNTYVKNSSGYVIVDFYKGWCLNCLYMGWAFDQLASENYKNVKFYSAQAYGTPCVKTDSDYQKYYNSWKERYSSSFGSSDYLKYFLEYESGEKHQACSAESYDFNDTIPFVGGGENYTPTVLLYKDGNPIARLGATDKEGYCLSKSDVKAFLDTYVK